MFYISNNYGIILNNDKTVYSQCNGYKVEKGMEVDVSCNGFSHNHTGTVLGQELKVAASQQKYGKKIKPLVGG